MWDRSLIWRDWTFGQTLQQKCLVFLRQQWGRFYRSGPGIKGTEQQVSTADRFLLTSPWCGWAIHQAIVPERAGPTLGSTLSSRQDGLLFWDQYFRGSFSGSPLATSRPPQKTKQTNKNHWEVCGVNRTYLTGFLAPDCALGTWTQIPYSNSPELSARAFVGLYPGAVLLGVNHTASVDTFKSEGSLLPGVYIELGHVCCSIDRYADEDPLQLRMEPEMGRERLGNWIGGWGHAFPMPLCFVEQPKGVWEF